MAVANKRHDPTRPLLSFATDVGRGVVGGNSTPGEQHLLGQGLHWGDVDTAALRVLQQHPQDGKLRTDGLPAAGGSSHKDIFITVIDCVEDWKGRGKEKVKLPKELNL